TYNKMAILYDHFMQEAPYDQWTDFTTTIFKEANLPIQHLADLGCGTGEITIRLAKQGYQIYGIDRSEEMLTYAQQKASINNVPVHWLQQDIRKLHGLKDLDAIISYCDVINYVTNEADVLAVFAGAAQALHENGL